MPPLGTVTQETVTGHRVPQRRAGRAMDLTASPSVGTELQTLRAELGALQAGQAAELGQLERALALAQAERAAATAEATQQAEEVARLRDEVAGLRAELRRGQELCAQHQLEATALRADARLKEQRHRCATAEVARLREELGRLRAQRETLGEEHGALRQRHHRLCRHLCGTRCHRCPEGPGGTRGPLPVPPYPEDPEDAQPQYLEGTQSQETTGGLKPFLLFILASAIIFLYPYLKKS